MYEGHLHDATKRLQKQPSQGPYGWKHKKGAIQDVDNALKLTILKF
jgi:hypothetical protein